jgi:hypothetical protein
VSEAPGRGMSVTRASFGRPLPHALDAEKAVLGAVLIDDRLLAPAAAIVAPDDFFRVAHTRLFIAMLAIAGRGGRIDLITLVEELGDAIETVGGPAYIGALTEGVPRSANIEHYARIVQEKAGERRLVSAATDVVRAALEGRAAAARAIVRRLADEDRTVCRVCGSESCDDPRHGSVAPAAAAQFRAAAEWLVDAAPITIVEGFAFANRVTVIASESSAGKTFVLLSIAAAVSDVGTWCGRAVAVGSVAYLSFEGDALNLRLRALVDVQHRALDNVYLLRAAEPLSPTLGRDRVELPSLGERLAAVEIDALGARLAADGRPAIALVIVDTVRASLTGSEDSSEDVSAYLRVVRRLVARVPGAAIVLAHHSGWQDGDAKRPRERGSSAWRGNSDATLYLDCFEDDVARGEARLTLRALKMRDVERPAPLALIRRRVELGICDADGRPLTSCIIEPDTRTAIDRAADEAAKTEGDHHVADLQLLRLVSSRPDLARSAVALRAGLGVKQTRVEETIARLLQAGHLARPEKQRHPYTITAEGCRVLADEASKS